MRDAIRWTEGQLCMLRVADISLPPNLQAGQFSEERVKSSKGAFWNSDRNPNLKRAKKKFWRGKENQEEKFWRKEEGENKENMYKKNLKKGHLTFQLTRTKIKDWRTGFRHCTSYQRKQRVRHLWRILETECVCVCVCVRARALRCRRTWWAQQAHKRYTDSNASCNLRSNKRNSSLSCNMPLQRST
jgi:hypothetical protein